MKVNKKIAMMIAAIMIANGVAKAETTSTTKNEISVSENLALNNLLANGQEKEFAQFTSSLNANDELSNYHNVLTVYNNNPCQFLAAGSASKEAFNKESEKIQKMLGTNTTKETYNWLYKVKYTTATLNLLWDLKSDVIQDTNQDILEEGTSTTL